MFDVLVWLGDKEHEESTVIVRFLHKTLLKFECSPSGDMQQGPCRSPVCLDEVLASMPRLLLCSPCPEGGDRGLCSAPADWARKHQAKESSGRCCLPPDKPSGECPHAPARPLYSLLTLWADSPALTLLLLPNTHPQGISHFPSQKFPKEPELEISATACGTQHMRVFWLEWWQFSCFLEENLLFLIESRSLIRAKSGHAMK